MKKTNKDLGFRVDKERHLGDMYQNEGKGSQMKTTPALIQFKQKN
jgi:hypothetical protein